MAFKTDASSNIQPFNMYGRDVLWTNGAIQDVTSQGLQPSGTLVTLPSVPLGLRVTVIGSMAMVNTAVAWNGDVLPAEQSPAGFSLWGNPNNWNGTSFRLLSDKAQHLKGFCSTLANSNSSWRVFGWVDPIDQTWIP
jgi:hypothetical protein